MTRISNTVDPEAQLRVSLILDQIVGEILTEARSLDYALSTNLEASIDARLDQIGSLTDAEDMYSTNVGQGRLQRDRYGRPTLLANLIDIKERGLAAISAARDLKSLVQAEDPTDELEDSSDPNIVRG